MTNTPDTSNFISKAAVAVVTDPGTPKASSGSPDAAQIETFESAIEDLVEGITSDHPTLAILFISAGDDSDRPNIRTLYRAPECTLSDRAHEQLVVTGLASRADARPRLRRQLLPERLIIALPVDRIDQRQPDVIGVLLSSVDDPEQTRSSLQNRIESFAQWQNRQRIDSLRRQSRHAAATIDLLVQALDAETPGGACQVIASELERHLSVHRLMIGLCRNGGQRARLVAASDTSRIEHRSSLAAATEAAMDQTLRRGSPIAIIDSSDAGADQSAVARLAALEEAPLVVVPLRTISGTNVGAIAAVVRSDRSVQSVQQFLEAAAPAIAGTLNAADRKATSRLASPRRALRSRPLMIALAAVLAITPVFWIPIPHRLRCEASIEPAERRFIAAPFDATLSRCHVTPGDVVKAGESLATLDGQELRWRRASLQADYDKAVKERDSAQTSRDYAAQRIAELEMERLGLELDLLDRRLSRIEVRSPINGIVVAGDMQRAQGAPVETGQNLFEVAPLDAMVIETAIENHQIAYASQGQRLQLRLDAYPNRTWDTTVQQINPRSEIREDQNVFIAESLVENHDSLFRPGMKGHVRIDCGKRPLYWILFHRPWETVSGWFWW